MGKTQHGFSVIEGVMIVAIVGLVGAVGWLFWDNIANKNPDQEPAANVSSSQSPEPSPTVSTKTYTAESIGLAFDYPSTWTLSDTSKAPYKTNSPKDVRKELTAPSGFSLVFATISSTGLGGTGECEEATGFKNFGESKLGKSYAVITDSAPDGISLYLSNSAGAPGKKNGCMYQNLIFVSEATYETEDATYSANPHAFSFSTYISYEDAEQGKSTQKPNDKELNEAVAILMSVRKK